MQCDTTQTINARDKLRPSLISKVYREIARPFRPRYKPQHQSKPAEHAPSLASFDPRDCTVEPEGLELLNSLVRESAQFTGPIVEIGTLLGITATHMALVKQPGQKIITVDNYCWNPWNLSADVHHSLAQQVLLFLTESGHVDQVRIDKAKFYETYSGPPPSLVFLDAMHTYEETRKDIQWALHAGAKLIAGHDYCQEFPGVIQIVDEMGGPRDLQGAVWVLHPQR
jgi:predicted O-methyltransferase YrrM